MGAAAAGVAPQTAEQAIANYFWQQGCTLIPGAQHRRPSGFMPWRPMTLVGHPSYHHSADSAIHLRIRARQA